MKKLLLGLLACLIAFGLCGKPVSVSAASKPALSKSSTTITKGMTETAKVKNAKKSAKITWKSSNSKIAKISSKGKITGVSQGNAIITCKVKQSGKTYSLTETVYVYDLAQATGTSKRTIVSLNGEWSYTDYDNNESTVTVPHSWTYFDREEFDADRRLLNKTVTYKKTINVSDYAGKEIFLQFGAVNKVATVYVDDVKIGSHTGGYTTFNMDITKACEGKDEVTIKVRNKIDTEYTIPINADYGQIGGIYRDVNLVVLDQAGYLSMENNGADGVTLLSSVNLTKNTATLKPTVQLSNVSSKSKNLIASVVVRDANGKKIASGVKVQKVAAGKTNVTAKLSNITVKKPHLWQGTSDPYLYTVTTTIYRNGSVVDQNTQKIGFRTYKVKNGNFYLNGKKYQIHGVAMHQENDRSYVNTKADIKQSINDALEMGANAIRTAHYPHSQYTYQLLDEKGIVAWCEIPYIKATLTNTVFHTNAKQFMTEMVKQYENHPSIISWGIGNEVSDSCSYRDYYSIDTVKNLGKLEKQLAAIAKKYDNTRFVGEAQHNASGSLAETETWLKKGSGVTTVGMNIYYGWYNGYGEANDTNKKKITDAYTKRIKKIVKMFNKSSSSTVNYLITEYGAGGCIDTHVDLSNTSFKWAGKDTGVYTEDQGYYFCTGTTHPEEYQCYVHEAIVPALYGDKTNSIAKNSNIWGAFTWVLYDFYNYKDEGSEALYNTKGMITSDRKTKKDVFYYYKALWNTKKRFTHICSSRFEDRDYQTTEVKVYSNCTSVTLTVNGKSLGKGTKQQDGVFVWKNVKLASSGKSNTVKAVGTYGSKTYEDTCDTWVYTK